MTNLAGIDLSHHNGTVDWQKVPLAVRFAFVKATQGTSYDDPQYGANIRGALSRGIRVGSYHFMDDSDPVAQAKHFAASIGKPGRGHLPPIVDVEQGKLFALSQNDLTAHVGLFMETVLELTGRKCGIYVSDSVPSDQFGKSNWKKLTAGRFVWIARYGKAPVTRPYNVWQTSDHGTVAGIGTGVDLDVYVAPQSHLDAWALIFPAKVSKPQRLLKVTRPRLLRGADVTAVQRMLNTHGAHLKVDGVYGPNTARMVTAFQKKVGLSADGIVGPNTRKVLGL